MKEAIRNIDAVFQKRFPKSFENFESQRLKKIFELIKSSDKVSFDMDGVLIDSAVPVVNRANEMLHTDFTVDDIYGWYFIRDEAVKKGYSKEEAEKLNFDLWTDPYLLSMAEPIPGAIDFYRQLNKKTGDKIPLVTVRNSELIEVTTAWVKKYLPEASDLIYMRNKDNEHGNDFKIRTLKELGVNYHFDDSSDVIDLIVNRLNKTIPVHISYIPLDVEKSYSKRIFVIPSWEWSPKRYDLVAQSY